jgi:hypothetical protein
MFAHEKKRMEAKTKTTPVAKKCKNVVIVSRSIFYIFKLLRSQRIDFKEPILPGWPEPEFVNLLRSPRINYQPDGPVQQPYFSYRPAMLQRLAELKPRNRFLVSLNVYKYGLCRPV